ncbi:MAG: hypothetical protein EOO61_14360 [Hymenobacter sp.]|nr:MAG: hypothetical protein EOO61_14360 [Hymenobacter sp.]
MYPELDAAGGLGNALNAEFIKLDSCLKILSNSSLDKIPFPHSVVKKGKKFSQIYLAANEKLYLPDFWREGVCLAQGRTNKLTDLAKVLDFWLCQDVTTAELSAAFSFVNPHHKAVAFDEDDEIAYTWACIQADESRTDLKAFVDLAIRDVVLNKLFPFTSLFTLCFSRCTGYPYTCDTPTVTPTGKRIFGRYQYEVKLPGNKLAGSGSAAEALAIVKANLPPGIKPAIKGTAEDL